MKYYYVVHCCCWGKGKGKLEGKKGDDYCQWTFAFCGWSLSRRETFVHSGELFPFPILLVFSFLAVATRQRVRVIPLWLCVFYTVWMSLLLRTAQQSRALTYFYLISIPFCFNASNLKNPAFNAAIAFYNLIVQNGEYQS
jgi:hypothetical protein